LQLIADCQDIIDRHCATSDHTRFVCLSSVDGRLLGVAGSADRSVGQRIAAISSSLLGLAETFSREALRTTAKYNLISSTEGAIVVVRVPSSSHKFALALCADNTETVAFALRNALDLSESVARLLP
jgi:predicted regulator of Ras-like GTPase activity (Roadblock/LC7/MglB family)